MEALINAPRVSLAASRISLRTQDAPHFVDITDQVAECVYRSGLASGIALVTSRHTTAAIVVNEHEPELIKDLTRMLREVAPEERDYAHNAVPCGPEEKPNGHAHCRALLLSTSATLPIADGLLALGRWQRIFLVELDCPRLRHVTVTLLGM